MMPYRGFIRDAASKWLVEAFSSLQPGLSCHERTIGDASALIVESRNSSQSRTIIMACSDEPWVEATTSVRTPVSISALYLLDLAVAISNQSSNIAAFCLIDRDSGSSRSSILNLARERAKLYEGGRMIVVAAGLTPDGAIMGTPEALKLVEGKFEGIPRFSDHPQLDPDVKTALFETNIPFLIVDPWCGGRGQRLPVIDFITQLC